MAVTAHTFRRTVHCASWPAVCMLSSFMTDTPTRRDLELLTEPTRSQALDILQRLLASGCDEDRAVEIAFHEAEEWETSRCPSAATPQESPRIVRMRTTSGSTNREADGD